MTRALEQNLLRGLASAYLTAKQVVIDEGFASEIDWQDGVAFDNITETDLLREAAWVILSSGMSEVVVRRKFPDISGAFFEWESARKIVVGRTKCRNVALSCFNNPRKIDAIIHVADHVFKTGVDSVRQAILDEGVTYIMRLPYMGPATAYHFAKNIGLPAAKPDRHLRRIAQKTGYYTPQLMCSDIATMLNEKIAVVDLVLWRYATLHRNYLTLFPSRG